MLTREEIISSFKKVDFPEKIIESTSDVKNIIFYSESTEPKSQKEKDNDGIANKKFLKEIQVLKELEHPNIIKIFEYYIDNKYHYIISELLTGGELYETILKFQKFNEKKAAYIMKQILSALNYLHSKGIVHRDIKPENILVQKSDNKKKSKNDIDEINIKLIDFGASNFFKENEILTLKVGVIF